MIEPGPRPRRPPLPLAARRIGLTPRGFWALAIAVAVVFLAAAASYFLLFPDPSPGALPLTAALAAAAVGLPLLVAGLYGVCAEPRRRFCIRDR